MTALGGLSSAGDAHTFGSKDRSRGPASLYKAPESPCANKRFGVRNSLVHQNAGHQSGAGIGGEQGPRPLQGPYKAP
ncbi:hypothetical protein BGW36DRAFT_56935 [Talaromyces proteolyticus]|uniref:Uncharacterized protein n=1 Tax=Talaromyces proteolyticus TaxID=1131652 RepID=A0AAD4KKU5_9EURO|nr:uncharacterized protein BGW36DRAFT_56935 [Talaromyces proteolyticus]KAH8690526.1 hypothetical protein BGW36DRAFT_56935 [Talaromyces proteolyticus]